MWVPMNTILWVKIELTLLQRQSYLPTYIILCQASHATTSRPSSTPAISPPPLYWAIPNPFRLVGLGCIVILAEMLGLFLSLFYRTLITVKQWEFGFTAVCFSFCMVRVLDKAECSAFESTLNSSIVSYRNRIVLQQWNAALNVCYFA